MKMRELLQSVIWPAIAGNVAWAFFTVGVLEYSSHDTGPFWERVLLLGIGKTKGSGVFVGSPRPRAAVHFCG
jgi:hypothetical protein